MMYCMGVRCQISWCVGGCGGRCVECGVNVMGMMGEFEGGVGRVWALLWGF